MNDVVRHLARHQWVRLHGTPRVSVLVGGEHARAIWERWLAVCERTGTLLDGSTPPRNRTAGPPARRGTPRDANSLLDAAFDNAIRDALARATTDPAHRIAVLVEPDVLARWRHNRDDRLAAVVDEGRIDVAEPREVHGAPQGGKTSSAKGIPAKETRAKGGTATGSAATGAFAKPANVRPTSAGKIRAKPTSTKPTSGYGIPTKPAAKQGTAMSIANDTIANDAIADEAIANEDGAAMAASEIAAIDARSAAEAALFEALEATPATAGKFELNASLTVRHGSRAAEVDLLARAERIAVEIDGVHHFADPECYRRDRRKDLMMQAQGLLVVRLLAEDVLVDVRESVTIVCQALAYRRRLDAS